MATQIASGLEYIHLHNKLHLGKGMNCMTFLHSAIGSPCSALACNVHSHGMTTPYSDRLHWACRHEVAQHPVD